MILVSQYLHLSHLKTSLEQSLSSSENLNTYFDQMMLTYQKTASTGYPFVSKKNRVHLGVAWGAVMAWNFYILIFEVGKTWSVVVVYCFFELTWDGMMVVPFWARRRVILYQLYIQYFYGQNETIF